MYIKSHFDSEWPTKQKNLMMNKKGNDWEMKKIQTIKKKKKQIFKFFSNDSQYQI